jgi:hypothetical protein
MTTEATSAATVARRLRLPLRFSLRVLLVAFTAFAIGFPIWYRWPYSEEELHYWERNGQPDRTRPPWARSVTTWQRQWGGGRLKHGTATTYITNSKEMGQKEYRNGELLRWRSFGEDGHLMWISEYENGLRCRETGYRSNGSITYKTRFSNLRLHGDAEQHLADGRVIVYRFDHGRVTHRDGLPIKCPLFDKLAGGLVDPADSQRLTSHAEPEAGDTPQEQLEALGGMWSMPVVADSAATQVWIEPPFAREQMELASLIYLIARAADCDCDYQGGCIWVLPRSADAGWHDPTGVTAIQPPAGSPLAAAWRESLKSWGKSCRLDERLSAIAGQLAIPIDTARVEPTQDNQVGYSISTDVSFLEFRHALILLLYHTRCRAKLDGETLVILPPEELP